MTSKEKQNKETKSLKDFQIPKLLKSGWQNGYFKYFKIKEGDVVVDLGASKGDFTSMCLDVENVKCYAIEASNSNSEILESALKDWNRVLGRENFFPICRAITGDNTGEFIKIDTNITGGKRWGTVNCIAVDERESSDDSLLRSNRDYVETISFMDLVRENNITNIDFMKIDVEGSEYSIFDNEESFEFILNNCKKLTGEFHLQYLREVLNMSSEAAVAKTNKIVERFEQNGFKVICSPRGHNIKLPGTRATLQTNCLDFWFFKTNVQKTAQGKDLARSIAERAYSAVKDLDWNSDVSIKKQMQSRYTGEFDFSELTLVGDNMREDKDFFVDMYNFFDKEQEKYLKSSSCPEEARPHVRELFKNGIVKVEKLFSEEELEEIKDFQDMIKDKLHPREYISGYVNSRVIQEFAIGPKRWEIFVDNWREILGPVKPDAFWNTPSLPNDGQLRMQSKIFNNNHPPGVEKLTKNPIFEAIFAGYENVPARNDWRSNTEWIYPSPINHNGWHRDVSVTRLKAMVLLEDVDEFTAPLLFALGSHRAKKKYDKQHLHDRFSFTGFSKYGDESNWPTKNGEARTWPKHSLKKPKSHCGYVSPDSAPNELLPVDRKKTVTVGDSKYDLLVCTGKAGDVIFFDSCALHSGSRAIFKERRNISFSSVACVSPKYAFFSFLQANP